MKTTITFFRPMTHDAGFLESTWPHVSEEEGVKLQFEEEFDGVERVYEEMYGDLLMIKLIDRRRIVNGKFHPGRMVLPRNAVEYELVYEISSNSDIDEDEFFSRLEKCIGQFRDSRYRLHDYKYGNQTKKKEEEKDVA